LGVGLLLTAIVLGSALSSLVLIRFGDRFGRRRCYQTIYLMLAIAGFVVAIHPNLWTIALVGLTGVLSTDANDNGPATTLEQAMLAERAHSTNFPKLFGKYNGVAAIFGSLGALSQGWFSNFSSFNNSFVGYLVMVPVGLVGFWIASGLNEEVERQRGSKRNGLKNSPVRNRIFQLSALFSLDAAAGGLTTSAWLSFYLTQRYHASANDLGYLFFAFAILQSFSMFLAPYVAELIGLVMTMACTHLFSNAALIIAAFCGNFKIAIAFLLIRASLSQMDIPTRQALIMAVVPSEDRMAASAVTNAARYTVRPLSPSIAAFSMHIAMATPMVLAGSMKVAYDVAILLWAKRCGYLTRFIKSY